MGRASRAFVETQDPLDVRVAPTDRELLGVAYALVGSSPWRDPLQPSGQSAARGDATRTKRLERGCLPIGHARDASTFSASCQDGIRRDVTVDAEKIPRIRCDD
jgi:hypothetical protein